MLGFIVVILLFLIFLSVVASCIKIVPQAHAYVVERLGAYQGTWGVGLHFKMPIIDKVARKVLLKEQVVDFAPQPVITKDNVTMPALRTARRSRFARTASAANCIK